MKQLRKLTMTLALLITAVGGAWAQTQWESGSCTVTLSNGTLTVSGKGAMADYMYNSDRPWDNNRNDITSVVVESGVTSVGFNAFYFFSNMTSVTLPEGLTAIGGVAFSGCSSLQSITIPSTVTSIGGSAFDGCSAITSVTLPEGLTAIGTGTFVSCSNLTSITLPEGLTAIGANAFMSCSSLTSITIPSTVTSIGASAFMSCSAISDVNLYANPGNLTWGDASWDFKESKATQCHVLAEHLSTYQTKFSSANVTFVGDLEPLATPIDVTLNDAKSEASFQMPQYDVTATYTIKRDLTVDVAATIDDRIRIKKDGNDFQPVDATQINPVVTDNLDAENPVTLTVTTDYTLQLQKQGDTENEWTDVTALSVGNFRYKITGTGNYSGICYSEAFELFQGYEITVPAGEFATYYKDEPLRIEDEEADLYTIQSVSADKAVISSPSDAMPANTPMLVFNKSQQEKVILLIPCPDPDLAVTVAPEFQGTLTATTIAASTDAQTNYALNGKQFVWVKDAIEIGANKAWLSIPTAISNARALTIVFPDETTKITTTNLTNLTNGDWYDLNGRKLQGMPTKKGVYIMNGKKVVVK